jgi:hypothetical protein
MSPMHYDTKQAACYLGITPKFLQALRSRGGGPTYAKLGRRVVYPKHELDRWVTKHSHCTTSDSSAWKLSAQANATSCGCKDIRMNDQSRGN